MIRIVNYKPVHAVEIFHNGMNIGSPPGKEEYLAFAAKLNVPGQAFTAIDEEGRLVCSAGIFDIWKGVGEAWLVGSKILNDRGIFLTRIISRRFKVIIKTQKYKRIQCVVHNKWKSSQKFVELLGFENEGLMRKYGPDGFDYLRYAIVIGE